MNQDINYGPLTSLIGTWSGDKGMDIVPELDGEEINPYYETITFSECNDLTNAEEQNLVFLHYRQIVRRKSTDKVFHDESRYWMWKESSNSIFHSFCIPRGICVMAEGTFVTQPDKITFEVRSGHTLFYPESPNNFHLLLPL